VNAPAVQATPTEPPWAATPISEDDAELADRLADGPLGELLVAETCEVCHSPLSECVCCPDCDGRGKMTFQGIGEYECSNCEGEGVVL
jgi:hypothetical protein